TEALAAAGRDPTGLAGGRVARWGGNARMGGRDLYVVEADEYDRAFLSLAPAVAVVNNVEADHLECYDGSVAALEQAFAQFAGRDSTTCAMRPRRSRWCTSWGRTSSGRSRRSRNSPEWGGASSGWVKWEA